MFSPSFTGTMIIFDSLLDCTRSEDPKVYTPKSYLSEKEGVYTLEVELPGVKKEDIQIDLVSNLLKITAVRKRAESEFKYEREYHISNELDTANIKAANENYHQAEVGITAEDGPGNGKGCAFQSETGKVACYNIEHDVCQRCYR